MEVRYPRAGCEHLTCRYLPLPTVKCGYAENLDPSRFRMHPESCPRATAPQFSPAILLPGPQLVPISDSQVQALHSPHSGGFSRSVATWRTVPTVSIPARVDSLFHQLSRSRSGGRHLWRAGTRSRAPDVSPPSPEAGVAEPEGSKEVTPLKGRT